MDDRELEHWLRQREPARLAELWTRADAVRHEHVGDEVHLRGLIEVSSHCRRQCTYCGIRAGNAAAERYRLDAEAVLGAAGRAAALGCGTIVLQGGEDPALSGEVVASWIRRIKAETGLAVTLSLGERSPTELAQWRDAGADRYLLRFETSNDSLYARTHPPVTPGEPTRKELLGILRQFGFEVGSGVMIGLVGTRYADLVRDLRAFGELDLDMIGVGPYLPHPDTPLGREKQVPTETEVPNDTTTTLTTLALARILYPTANIPATTALATLQPDGRELGLRCGANVWMPNFTPASHRASYAIYPGKAAPGHVELGHDEVHETLLRLGRRRGSGPGPSGRFVARGHALAH